MYPPEKPKAQEVRNYQHTLNRRRSARDAYRARLKLTRRRKHICWLWLFCSILMDRRQLLQLQRGMSLHRLFCVVVHRGVGDLHVRARVQSIFHSEEPNRVSFWTPMLIFTFLRAPERRAIRLLFFRTGLLCTSVPGHGSPDISTNFDRMKKY